MSSKPYKVSGVVHAPLRAPTLAAPLVARTGGHRLGEPFKIAQLERELEETKLALAALEVTMKTGTTWDQVYNLHSDKGFAEVEIHDMVSGDAVAEAMINKCHPDQPRLLPSAISSLDEQMDERNVKNLCDGFKAKNISEEVPFFQKGNTRILQKSVVPIENGSYNGTKIHINLHWEEAAKLVKDCNKKDKGRQIESFIRGLSATQQVLMAIALYISTGGTYMEEYVHGLTKPRTSTKRPLEPDNDDKDASVKYFYDNTWLSECKLSAGDRSTLLEWDAHEYSTVLEKVQSVLTGLGGMLLYIPDKLRTSSSLELCAKDATYAYAGLLREQPGAMSRPDANENTRLDEVHKNVFDPKKFSPIYLKHADLESFIIVVHVPPNESDQVYPVSLLVVAMEDETTRQSKLTAHPRAHTSTKRPLSPSPGSNKDNKKAFVESLSTPITRYLYRASWKSNFKSEEIASTLETPDSNQYSEVQQLVGNVLEGLDVKILDHIPRDLRTSESLVLCEKHAKYEFKGLLHQNSTMQPPTYLFHNYFFVQANRFTSIYLKNEARPEFILVVHVPNYGDKSCWVSLLSLVESDEESTASLS